MSYIKYYQFSFESMIKEFFEKVFTYKNLSKYEYRGKIVFGGKIFSKRAAYFLLTSLVNYKLKYIKRSDFL